MELIEINETEYNLTLDLRYAATKNITGKKIFFENKCYLRVEAAEKLLKASKISNKIGLKIKIFDAYRPQYVQEALWKYDPNPVFLTHPLKGSPHTRGVAVDLTLTDLNNDELNMGTDFDDFSQKAYHESDLLNKEERTNRHILLSIMTLAGFDFYEKEWWHYQLFNSREFSIIKDASL